MLTSRSSSISFSFKLTVLVLFGSFLFVFDLFCFYVISVQHLDFSKEVRNIYTCRSRSFLYN